MTKKTPQTLTPKRRFPEFRDAPGWDEMRLGDQGDFLSSLTGKTAKDFDTGDASFIPYMNVFSNPFTDASDLRSVDVAINETQNAVAKGDVFFTVSSETQDEAGMSSVLLQDIENTYLNSFCALFRFDEGKSPNPGYLGYFLRSKVIREYMGRGSQGATRYNISKGTFRDTPLLIPDADEQQKIADCLGSLDDWIAAAGRKLAALRDHKRGLMQQLFPQPGQSQPQQRFPEFRDGPGWEPVRLSELGKLLTGLTYKPDDVQEEGLLVLRSSNVQHGVISLDDCVYVDPSVNRVNLSKPNDILICVRNGSKSLIGKNALLPPGLPKCTHGAFMTILRSKSPTFVFYLLQTDAYQRQVDADLGATINSINGKQLLRYKFSVPEPAEQQKIAACLTALDAQITAQAAQLDTLHQHKRGLMQQLFPAPEEQ